MTILNRKMIRILLAMERMEPLPPIEVYKLDDHYYIIDGHHRVSVAKWLGMQEIAAHVIEIQTEKVAQAQRCWQAVAC